jgi:hypothetical protein
MSEHWFGLRPNTTAVPVLYWGGRAIYRAPEGIDILWDRQQFNNTDNTCKPDREDLWCWIRKKGLPRLRVQLKRQGISARDDVLVSVVDREYTIIANPRRSHGYLYIGAWRNEATRTSE